MYAMTRTPILVAVLAASLTMGVAQAQRGAQGGRHPASTKALYPRAQFDTMLKQRIQRGQPDTPELRAAIREE
jgi:hypothetical protein